MWKTNLKVLLVALLVIGFYTGVAHIIPQLESEVPEALTRAPVSPRGPRHRGEKVYLVRRTACHGLGTRAPNLLTDQAGQGPIGSRCGSQKPGVDCKAYLYESLTTGRSGGGRFENIMTHAPPDVRGSDLGGHCHLQSRGAGDRDGRDLPGRPGRKRPHCDHRPRALLTEKGCIGCHLSRARRAIGPPFDGIGRHRTAEYLRRSILFPNADTAKGYEKFAGPCRKPSDRSSPPLSWRRWCSSGEWTMSRLRRTIGHPFWQAAGCSSWRISRSSTDRLPPAAGGGEECPYRRAWCCSSCSLPSPASSST